MSAPPENPPDAWRENVAAIVLDAAGRVLLGLSRGGKHWHFPQGGVAKQETQEEALHRELREEVGLEPSQYRVLARYGGLRYRYRKGNEKRERWQGQQQTYFLLQCYAEMPPTDCSHAEEFACTLWLPQQELRPELFVKFKREVAAQALAHFFPPAGAPPPFAFGGDKEAAALHRERLALRLHGLQKRLEARGGRVLILLHGEQGSGRRQALRRLIALMDPLRLRVQPAASSPLLLPAAGDCVLMSGDGSDLPPFPGCTLRLFLSLGGEAPGADWQSIPAERRWYRDVLLAEAVAACLEEQCLPAPLQF